MVQSWKDKEREKTHPSTSFSVKPTMEDKDSNTARTSSGGLLTFCRYFFTTSSGVLPADRKVKGEERVKGKEMFDSDSIV